VSGREIHQVICWDRGRPAANAAEGAKSFAVPFLFSRFALICGRDAAGPSKSHEQG